MNIVNAIVPIAHLNEATFQKFAYNSQGQITSRAVGAGNSASPIANKTLAVPANGIVVLSLVYQPGTTDTAPPLLKFQSGGVDVVHVGFPIDFSGAGQNIAFNLPEATYTLVTDMAGVGNGGCYYAAYAMQGGIG